MKESEKPVRHLLGLVARVGSLLAFVAFAGITAISVSYARNVLTRSIASENGTPRAWEKDAVAANKIKSDITASVINEQFVQYVSSLKNTDTDKAQYVTHLSSYFAETNHAGYLDLNSQTIEYTYTPEDSASWRSLNLSAPGMGDGDFKLSTKLYLGTAGSVNDTIYFRYNVEPTEEANTDTGETVQDTIAFKTMSEDGIVGVTQSTTTVSYSEVSKRDFDKMSSANGANTNGTGTTATTNSASGTTNSTSTAENNTKTNDAGDSEENDTQEQGLESNEGADGTTADGSSANGASADGASADGAGEVDAATERSGTDSEVGTEAVVPVETITDEARASLEETVGASKNVTKTEDGTETENGTVTSGEVSVDATNCETETGCTGVLGVSSYVPNTQIINGVLAEEKAPSFAVVSFGFKMVLITLGALVVCYVVYLITTRDKKKAKE